MNCAVLGSSSGGNCTAVWSTSSTLLVDCGFTPEYIEKGLRSLDAPPVSGLLLTHIHGDHVHPDALRHFLERKVSLLLPRKIVALLQRRHAFVRVARDGNLIRETSATGVELDGMDIRPFPVPHDSPGGCYGYVIRSGRGKKSLAIATDLAHASDGVEENFADRDVMIIESNHDPAMLEESGRPEWLKKRIREVGHLSNDQCAELVVAACRRSSRAPRAVLLAHISQECNTRELALACTRDALKDFHRVKVIASHPDRLSEVIEV